MSLIVQNNEHFDRVKSEAIKRGLIADLQEKLDYLANYASHGAYGEVRCLLGWDFAPLSFSFMMQVRDKGSEEWKNWFNGGLCFHPGRTGVDESLSVELCPSDKPHWSVHT